jgi:transposase InsO family protein
MFDVLRLLGALLTSARSSRAAREAESLFLRQQLLVLRRSAPARLRLRNTDRLIFVWLYRLFPSLLGAAVIFKPETLIGWHRGGFRRFWRWKSRQRVGRPAVSSGIRALVRQMNRENPLWGAPRIHGELLKLGIEIAQSSVAKYMERRRGPPSQGWKTFLRNHAPHITAVDLFVVPTIGFRLLYGLAILTLERRRLVLTNVTASPTAEWIARQITEAFPWDQAPQYLIRDRDSSYGAVVSQRLRAMGIRDRPIAPRSPCQNGHIERLIGSIRRECLDHVVVLGEAHLRRILSAYASYYNGVRTHLAIGKDAPLSRTVQSVGRIRTCAHTRRPSPPLRPDGINGRDRLVVDHKVTIEGKAARNLVYRGADAVDTIGDLVDAGT